jgi:hypothetical protein
MNNAGLLLKPRASACFLSLLLLAAAFVAGQSPPPGHGDAEEVLVDPGCAWSTDFSYPDFNSWINELVVYDDGNGPALYAGGPFTSADSVIVNHIARWDGNSWSPLASPWGSGTDGDVNAFAVWDDGGGPVLYLGGKFSTAAGAPITNHLARWDGTEMSSLGGIDSLAEWQTINTLTIYDDGSGAALYAAGQFNTAGGVAANNIVKWDGSTWSALSGPSGIGCDSEVFALAVFDDGSGAALYAGGRFGSAGGIAVSNIARWNGTEWAALSGPSGTGTDGWVHTLAAYDDGSGTALYAGGSFTSAGGVTAKAIARWDGSSWSGLGDTGCDFIGDILVADDGSGAALYAAGSYDSGGGPTNILSRWNGSSWQAYGSENMPGTTARDLAQYDSGAGPEIYVAGSFAGSGRIARVTSGTWTELDHDPAHFVNGTVRSLIEFDDCSGPALYAGGGFAEAGGVVVSNIGKLDGNGWSPLIGPSATGTSGPVLALAVHDDGTGEALYACGAFLNAGGVSVNRVARWDGSQWYPLTGPSGTGVDSTPDAMTTFDDGTGTALYVAGGFDTAGGVATGCVARWDGSQWLGFDAPVECSAVALAVFDDGSGEALYVGGAFSKVGELRVNNIMRWDGSVWSALDGPLSTGTDAAVQALAVFDDGTGEALYAAGEFVTAGGIVVNRIARWDGLEWSVLDDPHDVGIGPDLVETLLVYDDGLGPALYAGGEFSTAGGYTANSIARWDGAGWTPLLAAQGNGVLGTVHALAAADIGAGPTLFAGGNFSVAGGIASYGIAGYRCTPYLVFADGFESGDTQQWSVTVD